MSPPDTPSAVGRLRRRVARELHGRTPREAAADLWHLASDGGPRQVLQRLGIHVERVRPAEPAAPPLHPRVHTHAWGSAHAPIFDLTPEILAANRAVVDAFADRPGEVRTATWFLAYFEHALFGGVHTILRLMEWMRAEHGVEHRLVVFDRAEASDATIRGAITAAFPGLAGVDIVLPVDGQVPYDELPPTDIAVATLWVSAYPLARFNRTKAKFYMVADYEPDFYAAGTVHALAEATYRLGYAGIVNTPALGELYAGYGNPSMSFVPAVEARVADAAKPAKGPDEPVQVIMYGRPSTERNAFELLAAAASRVKEQFGPRVRIVSAGEEWSPSEFLLDGIIENRGLLHSLEEVERLYLESDIGICFMMSKHPSYQPLEYLNAGVAPICNVNPATGWLLRHEENCLITEPFPSNVAAAVARLVDDPALRASLVQAGQRDVRATSWPVELERVWRFVTGAAATAP